MASNVSDSISERIVTVAAKLFTEDGFDRTSMLAVAKEAKTSKREIYDRFGNKEALFEQVMNYLCDLGSKNEAPSEAEQLPEIMSETAKAVLRRFMLPETRGVLVAAIGASPSFPEIPKLFWNAGPGQAVTYLAALFKNSPEVNISDQKIAHDMAHRFIMRCVAPFALSYVFDPDFKADQDEIDTAIDTAISTILPRLQE